MTFPQTIDGLTTFCGLDVGMIGTTDPGVRGPGSGKAVWAADRKSHIFQRLRCMTSRAFAEAACGYRPWHGSRRIPLGAFIEALRGVALPAGDDACSPVRLDTSIDRDRSSRPPVRGGVATARTSCQRAAPWEVFIGGDDRFHITPVPKLLSLGNARVAPWQSRFSVRAFEANLKRAR